MKNKLRKTICGILATSMIFCSGCSNKDKKEVNSSTSSYSQSLTPDKNEEFSNVVLFGAYDEINEERRFYFTQVKKQYVLTEKEADELAMDKFGEFLSQEQIEKSEIKSATISFEDILNPYVLIVQRTLSLKSEEGYEGVYTIIDIEDIGDNVYITYHFNRLEINGEVLLYDNCQATTVDDNSVLNDQLTIKFTYSDRTYTYEEIENLYDYYKSYFAEETVLRKLV